MEVQPSERAKDQDPLMPEQPSNKKPTTPREEEVNLLWGKFRDELHKHVSELLHKKPPPK